MSHLNEPTEQILAIIYHKLGREHFKCFIDIDIDIQYKPKRIQTNTLKRGGAKISAFYRKVYSNFISSQLILKLLLLLLT